MPNNLKNWPKVFLGINAYSGKQGQRSPYLARLLASIAKFASLNENFDIIVYDDCSPLAYTEEVVNNSHIPVIFRKGSEPLVRPHLTRGALMEEFLTGTWEYAIFLDDDFLITQPNWLKHMIGCMENIPEIGILGGYWATLEDGKTRQLQHTPVGSISRNGFEVSINRFVCGGLWCVRRIVIETLGAPPKDVDYDGKSPGWDTYYHNLMLEETGLSLCCTRTDMAQHVGQEFMKGALKDKYTNEDYKAGRRIY